MTPRGRPFQNGNPGGPGRPKRTVERKYLKALVGVCRLKDWKEIVQRAVDDAKAGDAQARTWLSKHIVGDNPLDLIELVEEMRAELERRQNVNSQAGQGSTTTTGGGA
jgi:hypothetical protein